MTLQEYIEAGVFGSVEDLFYEEPQAPAVLVEIPDHITPAILYDLAKHIAFDIQDASHYLDRFGLSDLQFAEITKTKTWQAAVAQAQIEWENVGSLRIQHKTEAAIEHFLLPKMVTALQDQDAPMSTVTQIGKLLLELAGKHKVAEESAVPGANLKLLINVDLGDGNHRSIGISTEKDAIIGELDEVS